jgi:hypothetical protein
MFLFNIITNPNVNEHTEPSTPNVASISNQIAVVSDGLNIITVEYPIQDLRS